MPSNDFLFLGDRVTDVLHSLDAVSKFDFFNASDSRP